MPLDATVKQERLERNVEKEVDGQPGQTEFVKETPPPVIWPAYVLYLKPAILLVNVVPFAFFLVLYVRLLDRYAPNDWAWFVAPVRRRLGQLAGRLQREPEQPHGRGLLGVLRDLRADPDPGSRRRRRGRPHFVDGRVLGGLLHLQRDARRAVRGPPVPAPGVQGFPAGRCCTSCPPRWCRWRRSSARSTWRSGQFKPAYEEFGTKAYTYEGSYWNTPLEFDWFNIHPEPKALYLFHMTFGHHGVFSLSPIFLFSIYACVRNVLGPGPAAQGGLVDDADPDRRRCWPSTPGTPRRGTTAARPPGLRWLFWLIPFWLVVLPTGLAGGRTAGGPGGSRCWRWGSRSSRSATRSGRPGATPGSST